MSECGHGAPPVAPQQLLQCSMWLPAWCNQGGGRVILRCGRKKELLLMNKKKQKNFLFVLVLRDPCFTHAAGG
jgi:peptidyl-tRNA hydrolase